MKRQNIPDLTTGDWNIVCDFDGTITPFDVTDAVLANFASREWESIEREWMLKHITARQCMEKQVGLIAAPIQELDAFLDSIPISNGFKEFVSLCQMSDLPMLIVSDGLDYAIKRILTQHGLGGVPVIANRLLRAGDSRYQLDFPYGKTGCSSGVCKCAVASVSEGQTLLVGDGRSDCCLAHNAAFVLAKQGKELHNLCKKNAYAHLTYDDFSDVYDVVGMMLQPGDAKQKRKILAA